MSLFISSNGSQREITKLNCGINAANRDIFSAFAGISGVNREIFSGNRTLADLPSGTKILDPYHSNSKEPNMNKFILLNQTARSGHSLLFTEYASESALPGILNTPLVSNYTSSYYQTSLISPTVTFFQNTHSPQLISALSPTVPTYSNKLKYNPDLDSFSFQSQSFNTSVFPLSATELGKSTAFSDRSFSGVSSSFSSAPLLLTAANAKPYFTRTIGYYTDSNSNKRFNVLTVSSDGVCDIHPNIFTVYFRYAFWLPSDTAVSKNLIDGYFSLQF